MTNLRPCSNNNRVSNKKIIKNDTDFLTIEEAAEYLGISSRGVKQKISEGAFPSYKPSKKLLFVKLSELKEWISRERNCSVFELESLADEYLMESQFNQINPAA